MADESKDQIIDPIVREIGERVIIDGGKDYIPPTARVILSMHADAGETEKAVYISQGKTGISVSLQSIIAIANWLKGG